MSPRSVLDYGDEKGQVKGKGEKDDADPDLLAAGRLFKGKSLIVIFSPGQVLSAGCCSLKAVVFEDILVYLSVLE